MSITKDFLSFDAQNTLKDLPIIQNPHQEHVLQLEQKDIDYITDILDKTCLEYQNRNGWQNGMLLSYVSIFLIYCSRLYTEQFDSQTSQPESILLNDFLALVDMQYRQMHEVSQYAQELNISAGYLGETVKQQSGKSAIDHIQERIVLEAKRLIYFTDQSIKEIAFDLGFQDASYFNRFFKRHTNHTPLAYRNHTRKMYH